MKTGIASTTLMLFVFLAAMTVLLLHGDQRPSQSVSPSKSLHCDQSLWKHVYHPYRLRVVQSCAMVTGTIEHIIKEPDGDDHIRVKLDAPYEHLLDADNFQRQHGDLVVEPMCENPVTQADAIEACRGWHNPIVVPRVGTHVRIVGTLVHDMDHGGWTEIHPPTSIQAIGK